MTLEDRAWAISSVKARLHGLYENHSAQTAHQMNMACVLKKTIIHKSRWQARFGPRFPMEARAEKWSLPGKFILLPDPVLFISNCQHSVSAKEAQEHAGATRVARIELAHGGHSLLKG